MAAAVEYKAEDVLTAARRRISLVFDRFADVVVSVSSGKDSTVLFHLALAEAARRKRTVEVFFLDQEAEYQSSIDVVGRMMSAPGVVPRWYQVPVRMTNATSHRDYFLYAWGPGEKWMRDKHPLAVHDTGWPHPERFYDFFAWHEGRRERPTAFLVGLRSKESLTRFRAVTKNAGHNGVPWSTRGGGPHAFRFYPLYDWTFGDVWKYIADEGVPYNRVYDWYFAKHGVNMSSMRVSNLIHEKSFRCLADLQEFEPDTYDRLVSRIGGVHCAALYATDGYVYNASALPATFSTWRQYRDYLLASTPTDRAGRFARRFSGQRADESTCQMQCKQLLLNDWENNVPVRKGMSDEVSKVWWDRL